MKKNIYILFTILSFLNIKPESYKIEKIESADLSKEYKVFAAFRSFFAHESAVVCEQSFDEEEQAYYQKLETRLFLHALLGDEVIGYISCDLISKNHVIVTQWAIEPSIFETMLIKDLLFALFQQMNNIQTLRINCPAKSRELISFFEDLGFTLVEKLSNSKNIVFEFKRSSKCKLCDLLYGHVWNQEDEEELLDESEDLIVVHPSELVMSETDYN